MKRKLVPENTKQVFRINADSGSGILVKFAMEPIDIEILIDNADTLREVIIVVIAVLKQYPYFNPNCVELEAMLNGSLPFDLMRKDYTLQTSNLPIMLASNLPICAAKPRVFTHDLLGKHLTQDVVNVILSYHVPKTHWQLLDMFVHKQTMPWVRPFYTCSCWIDQFEFVRHLTPIPGMYNVWEPHKRGFLHEIEKKFYEKLPNTFLSSKLNFFYFSFAPEGKPIAFDPSYDSSWYDFLHSIRDDLYPDRLDDSKWISSLLSTGINIRIPDPIFIDHDLMDSWKQSGLGIGHQVLWNGVVCGLYQHLTKKPDTEPFTIPFTYLGCSNEQQRASLWDLRKMNFIAMMEECKTYLASLPMKDQFNFGGPEHAKCLLERILPYTTPVGASAITASRVPSRKTFSGHDDSCRILGCEYFDLLYVNINQRGFWGPFDLDFF
jgi:hypothetical protein